MEDPPKLLRLTVYEVKQTGVSDGASKLEFLTSRGVLHGLLHQTENPTAAVIWVGGVGGGFNGPAGSMYLDLAKEILPFGIDSLRLDYRRPKDLEECVLDVMAGITYLEDQGIHDIGLVGHSLGGAVVIEAGVNSDSVKTVVAISSQTYGTSAVSELSPRSLLLLHGTADKVLPPACSEDIYRRARKPKEIVLYPGDDHVLSKSKDKIRQKVGDWLLTRLPVKEASSNDEEDKPQM